MDKKEVGIEETNSLIFEDSIKQIKEVKPFVSPKCPKCFDTRSMREVKGSKGFYYCVRCFEIPLFKEDTFKIVDTLIANGDDIQEVME